MLDVHCHIADELFFLDRDDVLLEAKQMNVTGIVAVAEHQAQFKDIIDLSKRYEGFIHPCLGVHPVQMDDGKISRSITLQELDLALPIMEQYADHLCGVGEVGLDFTPRFIKTEEDKNIQRQVLIRQERSFMYDLKCRHLLFMRTPNSSKLRPVKCLEDIKYIPIEFAKKHNLPLNVHSRSAGKPTIQLLKENGVKEAVLHAFDGRPSVAMVGVQCGFYFSIPPSIIRGEQKSKLVEQVPLENLLLETDSPALGPEKQVRNVPSNLKISCEYIASIKKLDVDTVVRVTTENALKLFPKLKRFYL